ncbi:MAG: DUF1294 domain-containing protein [Christensenellaceae bacterium]|jgi:uncharacterized membrane protein YsdA (DUF1294 family)|nr:DUF1294 domain-containing protein [Christensenellaceae bacterium]
MHLTLTPSNWLWYALGIWALLFNLVEFAMMGIDKWRARKEAWRIPEKTLFITALLGGGLGGVLGMSVFRHKTQHRSFLIGMPLLLALNILITGLIIYLRLR